MKWAGAPPKEPGWYWHKDPWGGTFIYKIMVRRGELFVVTLAHDGFTLKRKYVPVENTDGQWAGPLEEP